MAYYNEFFIENDKGLVHVGSCTGSDTPCYFNNVKSLQDWKNRIEDIKFNNHFYPHSNKHPFPWGSYKTSDNLIVLRKINRKWFDFWNPKYEVFISVDKYDIDDENSSYFININKWFGNIEYDKSDLVILKFPILKRINRAV